MSDRRPANYLDDHVEIEDEDIEDSSEDDAEDDNEEEQPRRRGRRTTVTPLQYFR